MSQFLCQELALSSGLLAGPRRGSVSSESALDQHVGDGNTLNGGLILPVSAPVVPHREVLRSRRSWSGSRKPLQCPHRGLGPGGGSVGPGGGSVGPGGGSAGPGPTSSIFSLINTRMELKGKRCQCGACEEYFTTTSHFDKHRVGPYDGRVGREGQCRRCLTVYEMEQHDLHAPRCW